MRMHGQNLTEEQLQTEIVQLLTHRSAMTNPVEKSGDNSLANIGSPMSLFSLRQENAAQLEELQKKRDQKKIDMIRQETMKTIKALQDFVKRSQNQMISGKNKQNTVVKIGTLHSQQDSSQNQDTLSKLTSPHRGVGKSQKKNSNNSITIEESSENSSNEDQDLQTNTFRKGQKSTNSKASTQAKLQSNHNNHQTNLLNKSISENQRSTSRQVQGINSANVIVNLTPKGNLPNQPQMQPQKSSTFMSQTQHQGSIQFQNEKFSEQESPQQQKKSSFNMLNEIKKKKSNMTVIGSMNQTNLGGLSSLNEDDEDETPEGEEGFEDFQNEKERELFGAARKQLRELENKTYVKKMKQFDDEITRLKKAQKIKNSFLQDQAKKQQSFKSQRPFKSNNPSPKRQLFDFNILELSQRINQLEKNQEQYQNSGQNINIVNSNIVVDNAFIPEFLLRKLGASTSPKDILQTLMENKLKAKKSSFNFSTKQLDMSLQEARQKAIGSQQQQKDQRYQKLYGEMRSQLQHFRDPQNFSFDNLIQGDRQGGELEQTARFQFRHQNTQMGNSSTNGSIFGGAFHQGAGQTGVHTSEGMLRPKYNKNEIISDKSVHIQNDAIRSNYINRNY